MSVKHYTDFSGGLDTRQGLFLDDAKRFQELKNAIITPGKKPERRSPLVAVPGLIDVVNTKGIQLLDGSWITFAAKGSPVAHTTGLALTTKYFDIPDSCNATDWELVASGIYGAVPYAVIRHTFPGGPVTSIIKLHLWDERKDKPTYVEDPSCPTNWTKELPQYIYGSGDPGSFFDYTPVVGIVSNSMHMSRPDGNVGRCKTNDARVWNSRSVDQVLTQGDLYYFIQPASTTGVCTFTVSLPHEELAADGRWAAYVFELLLDDGTWFQLEEVAGFPVSHNTYYPAPVASRFTAGKNEIQLQARLANIPGRVLRFRAIAKAAPLTIISGGRFEPGSATVTPAINDAKVQWEGAAFDSPQTDITIPALSAGKDFLVGIPLPGSTVPPIREILTPGVMPYNGYERYRIRILARAIVHGSGTYFVSTLSGTHDIQSLSNTVKGNASSLYTTELLVGDRVLINGEERVVSTIVSDKELTVDNVFTTTLSNGVMLRRQTYNYASDVSSGNQWYVQKEVDAILYKAGQGLASFINTSFYDNSGGRPTLITGIKNRLGVFYTAGFQLWQTDPDPSRYAFLDGLSVGTGRNTRPVSVEVAGDALVPTDSGPRSFNASGLNYDAAEDQNLGEILDGTLLPPLTAAAWWSYKNLYITAGVADGVLTVLALTVIRSVRTNAWSTFEFAGVTSIDTIVPDGERLYIISGARAYYLDAIAEDFIDSNDPEELPYETKGRWHFLHFGQPDANKRMQYMDCDQRGKATWTWFPNPYLPDQGIGPIVLPSGPTWGRARVPLACKGAAISFEFSSRDRGGYRLEALQVEYQPTKR
jgi:hypothetical protein